MNKFLNFVVIGAAKSGTTALCSLLDQHPSIRISTPKEPNYFSVNYKKGESWYLKRFYGIRDDTINGEGSTDCTIRDKYPFVAERIFATNANCKLIFMARHPIHRLISNWQMLRRRDPSTPDFSASLRDASLNSILINRSKYFYQLEPFLERFPKEQLHIIITEDFRNNQQAHLQSLSRFIGVNSDFEYDSEKVSANARSNLGSTKLRATLLKTSLSKSAINCIPKSIRGSLKKNSLFTKRVADEVQWTKGDWEFCRKQLEPDASRFLSTFGFSPNKWSFDRA